MTIDQPSSAPAGAPAGYKTPKFVTIVGSLPKNPSGKILKRELRDSMARLAEETGNG
jgi:fatty-acyl-CoA synthase